MELNINADSFSIVITKEETSLWATSWPCSILAGKRVMADYDTDGLLDLEVESSLEEIPSDELNAIVADHMKEHLPEGHPCHFMVIGQFAVTS
tara:strand:+ start:153 stop:431 length:279 start_codon:yes stop_codon:yes gene_type:complete